MSWFGDNSSWIRHAHQSSEPKSAAHKTHHPSSSSDFGDFHSASQGSSLAPHDNGGGQAAPSANRNSNSGLGDNDLLMSFDEEAVPPGREPTPILRQRNNHQRDFLTEEPLDTASTTSGNSQRPPSIISRTADSSPTRQRHFSAPFPGPSSPPRLSSAGSDIVFQAAPPRTGKGDATTEFRRIRRMSDQNAMAGKGSSHRSRSSDHSLNHSRSIAEALSATKLATRWKRSVLHNEPVPGGEAEPPTKTAQPIDISHTSPFAMKDQIAGAYIPPDGAPGYVPEDTQSRWDEANDWANTKLKGRRELTTPVLSQAQASSLRPHLPARQRLSDSWNLLFSLDQHGASLSTLYRLVEQYAKDHKNVGNVLVVNDAQGNNFGIYVNEPIVRREGTYYGSGEAFMFKFGRGQGAPHVFPWTGRNKYIALCETNFISFGGGGTSYGLLLDSTFSHNSSATSPAFQNEVLCGAKGAMSEQGVSFDCIGLEVWATS